VSKLEPVGKTIRPSSAFPLMTEKERNEFNRIATTRKLERQDELKSDSSVATTGSGSNTDSKRAESTPSPAKVASVATTAVATSSLASTTMMGPGTSAFYSTIPTSLAASVQREAAAKRAAAAKAGSITSSSIPSQTLLSAAMVAPTLSEIDNRKRNTTSTPAAAAGDSKSSGSSDVWAETKMPSLSSIWTQSRSQMLNDAVKNYGDIASRLTAMHLDKSKLLDKLVKDEYGGGLSPLSSHMLLLSSSDSYMMVLI
jgi:hypothetical protein